MVEAALLWGSIIAAAAGFMRGFAGVGSGMLMAPFFVHLFGAVETVAIIICMEIVVTAQLLPSVWKAIDWRLIVPIAGAAAVCMPLGTWLLVDLDAAIAGRIVALVVIIFAAVLLAGWRYRGPRPLPLSMGIGTVSGVLMALTSLGNPPVMIYLLSSGDSAARNRANFTGYFGLTLTALIAMMAFGGLIDRTSVVNAGIMLPVFMLAAWAGARLFRKANEDLYRKVALGILLAAGVIALLR